MQCFALNRRERHAMRRIILNLPNGTLTQTLLLTAIVRDLDLAGNEVDVRTAFPDLWANNFHLTPCGPDGDGVKSISLSPGCTDDLGPDQQLACMTGAVSEQLGTAFTLSQPRGDIHLSRDETSWLSQVGEITDDERPFWILEPSAEARAECLQPLVDEFRGRILFAEAALNPRPGAALDGVIDLRDKTPLRHFIRLIYNAQGILSCSPFTRALSEAIQTREASGHLCLPLAADIQAVIQTLEIAWAERAKNVDVRSVSQRATDNETRIRDLFAAEQLIPFSAFNNRYAGRECCVVGRGPTRFDYARLAQLDCPVFFINDAVSLEHHVRGESFFFAHDANQQVWLKRGLKSTAVLPLGGKFWGKFEGAPYVHRGSMVLYEWPHSNGAKILERTRDELALARELTTCTGTIHSLLHFLWFCGFTTVKFIGCDGINDCSQLSLLAAPSGYDTRIANESESEPWWQYETIRTHQDRLCRRFALRAEYVGTPSLPKRSLQIPALAHFLWLGGPVPKMVRDNIDRFRQLHPDWDVRLWLGVPPGMPDDLMQALYSTHELCMRADIIRLWLLHENGGVYLDGDIFALRSFDELRGHESFAAFRLHGTLNNAVLGSTAHSAGITRLIEEVRATFSRCPSATRRTAYGPDLLSRVHHRSPGLLRVLPAHYFYIFQTQGTALRFIAASEEDRRTMIDVVRDRISDREEPFAIHTWGIPKELMPPGTNEQSSWIAANAKGDELLRRLPNTTQHAAEVGARDGQLAAYWLGHNAALDLWTAAHNGEAEVIRQCTDFAGERSRVGQRDEFVRDVADRSLDWLFVHRDVADDREFVARVAAKLKPGALLATDTATGITFRVAQSPFG